MSKYEEGTLNITKQRCLLALCCLALLPAAALAWGKDQPVTPSVIPTNNLPKVLMFGDSICGGYGAEVIKLLAGKATVTKLGSVAGYRIKEQPVWQRGPAGHLNFGSALFCVSDFDRFEKHLAETKYDCIHFNFGLNDIFRGRNGKWYNPPEQYAEHLDKIVTLLKANGAKIIWATTTPIPDNDPDRPAGDDLIYNAAAEKVMKKHGIPVNDLHGVITRWDGYAGWKKGNDVHFSGAVYEMLAKQVADKIAGELTMPDEKR